MGKFKSGESYAKSYFDLWPARGRRRFDFHGQLCESGAISLDKSDFIGYGSMLIALSMIFFGIKSYRDNYQHGAIKFGKGVRVGMLIAFVAALLYAIAGETYYQIDPAGQAAMMEKYAEYHVNKLKENGAASTEIEQKAKEMAELKEMHQKPLPRFVMTLMIILPVGVAITLIRAAILRKRKILPV